ncbi:MAG TPA: FAD-dependent oxidoreductase, partial [Terriglobales bacterium]|nr:FAD-dependent oxidoreductase [Terriglobales bacterium]
DGQLRAVVVSSGGREQEIACDYLACGFGLVPNSELGVLLGCELQNGFVRVDDSQRTSVEHVYCAGEPTGIGGLELSLVEGQIAGLVATGQTSKAQQLLPRRASYTRFAQLLESTFALRDELKRLASDDTLVCRCEDVSFARARHYSNWRAAKLQTRCGMGPCQGRVCGPAMEFMLGWRPESVRPPVFPARLGSLAQAAQEEIPT